MEAVLQRCNHAFPSSVNGPFMTHGFKKTKANFGKFHVARRWCIFSKNSFFLRHDGAAAARGAAWARRLFFILIRAAWRRIQPTLGHEGWFSSGQRRAQLVHAPRRPASLKKAQRAVHLPE
ncbi:MAG: hypothetical protein ACLPTF_18790 [Steroidobacteraceae bacterium]